MTETVTVDAGDLRRAADALAYERGQMERVAGEVVARLEAERAQLRAAQAEGRQRAAEKRAAAKQRQGLQQRASALPGDPGRTRALEQLPEVGARTLLKGAFAADLAAEFAAASARNPDAMTQALTNLIPRLLRAAPVIGALRQIVADEVDRRVSVALSVAAGERALVDAGERLASDPAFARLAASRLAAEYRYSADARRIQERADAEAAR